MQFDATVPVILYRVHQARVLNALEPEWEARFEPKSDPFRPGRGCHDAIAAIFQVAKSEPQAPVLERLPPLLIVRMVLRYGDVVHGVVPVAEDCGS